MTDPETITDRERDVLILMASGATDAQIGASLYIAKTTVHTHVVSIRSKLGATNRTRAVVRGLALGVISLEQVTDESVDPVEPIEAAS